MPAADAAARQPDGGLSVVVANERMKNPFSSKLSSASEFERFHATYAICSTCVCFPLQH